MPNLVILSMHVSTLVLHTVSGGNNTWPGTPFTSTTGQSALTAATVVAVLNLRNWASGNYTTWSHDYVLGHPTTNIDSLPPTSSFQYLTGEVPPTGGYY